MNRDFSNKTVLHIAPTPFFADRGCHIRIASIVHELNSRGVRNLICTYHHGRDVDGIETARILKIPGYTKKTAGYSKFKYLADIYLIVMVIWKVWRIKPDIIHGHLHEGALIGFIAKTMVFWRRTPLIFDVQGSLVGELVAYGTISKGSFCFKVFKIVEQIVYTLPNLLMCSSKNSLKILSSEFTVPKEKLLLIADGTDLSKFKVERSAALFAQLKLPSDKKIVVFSGSLLPAKGVEELKDLIADSVEQKLPVHFLLIGYPVEDIKQWVREKGLERAVTMTGQLEYERLPDFLALADIAIEPKITTAGEASGKLVNYMAAGLTVVGFNSELNRKFLADSGFLVNREVNRLLPALEQAIKVNVAELQEKSLKNRTKISNNYSWAATVDKILLQYHRFST
ncbi:MAG: glycosyltransferase [Cyanobacteria bacterium P01_E01_bin.35]